MKTITSCVVFHGKRVKNYVGQTKITRYRECVNILGLFHKITIEYLSNGQLLYESNVHLLG